jgi:hypothetical protein
MPDEQESHRENREPPATTPTEGFASYTPGARDPGLSDFVGTITSIKRRIVGFRRGDDTVDAVEALGRLFTAIGDLLQLAQADRNHDSSAVDEAAGDGENPDK